MASAIDRSGVLVGNHPGDAMGNVTDSEIINCERRIANLVLWFLLSGEVPEGEDNEAG